MHNSNAILNPLFTHEELRGLVGFENDESEDQNHHGDECHNDGEVTLSHIERSSTGCILLTEGSPEVVRQ